MIRLAVIVVVGLNLITLSVLATFMLNAESFVDYFDTRLGVIELRLDDAANQADNEGALVGFLFSNVFEALQHMHDEELKPVYEALRPVIEGVPRNEEYPRPIPQNGQELEARTGPQTY